MPIRTIKAAINEFRREPRKFLHNEFVFGALVILGCFSLNFAVFARLIFSGEYTFGGDTYIYWSFNYLILHSIKFFNSLPWWDPTNYGGYPFYFHFTTGWSNILSPYYVPSLLLFKLLSLVYDVSINSYLIFHRTVYVMLLNMTAIYLVSHELIKSRIARILPVFVFSFSYFQLMNFHDFYAIEAMIAPLFFIYGLIRFNNSRTRKDLSLLVFFLSLLLASLHYGLFMSALYWTAVFTALMLVFNFSIFKDAFRLLTEASKTAKGRIAAGLLLLLVVSGMLASWLPFHYNSGHVIRYREEQGPSARALTPVNYDAAEGLTTSTRRIVTSEIWTALFGWLPFPEVHDNLLRFAWHGHENRYIGLATLPLILTALILGLRNRYSYILLLTFLICNTFVIYATDNLAYKIVSDNSDIFANMANMSTIFPRGGPYIFLLFLAGIGLDRLVAIAKKSETAASDDIPFERLFRTSLAALMILSFGLIAGSVLCGFYPQFLWLRHSLAHIGIYLLIFSFICRILLISNHKVIRQSSIFCLFLLTFTDLTVSASSVMLTPRPYAQGDVYNYVVSQPVVPFDMLKSVGAVIPDEAEFKPVSTVSDQMFPVNYRGGYHNADRIHWSTKEWLVLATREDYLRFLPNWDSKFTVMGTYTSVRMNRYPMFLIYANGYYLPFEKIRELDTDKSIPAAEPLFYLHDEQLVRSKNSIPREEVNGNYNITEYTPNKVVMETKTDRDGFLYFLDNLDPFWSASVDGKAVKLHRANFTFKAIELPAGDHEVKWFYNPWPVKTAYLVFYLILACVIAVLALLSRMVRLAK